VPKDNTLILVGLGALALFALKDVRDGIGGLFGGIGQAGQGAGQGVSTALTGAGQGIGDAVSGVGQGIGQIGSTAGQFTEDTSGTVTGVIDSYGNLWETIFGTGSKAVNRVSDESGNVLDWLKNKFSGGKDDKSVKSPKTNSGSKNTTTYQTPKYNQVPGMTKEQSLKTNQLISGVLTSPVPYRIPDRGDNVNKKSILYIGNDSNKNKSLKKTREPDVSIFKTSTKPSSTPRVGRAEGTYNTGSGSLKVSKTTYNKGHRLYTGA